MAEEYPGPPGANHFLHIHGARAVGGAELSAGTFQELPVHGSWRSSRLVPASHRYEMRALFYAARDDRFALCGVLKSPSPADLDEAASSMFLRFPGDHTPFRSIGAIAASANLTWQAGELRVGGRGASSRAEGPFSRPATVEGAIEGLRFHIESKVVFQQLAYLQQLSRCSLYAVAAPACSRANRNRSVCSPERRPDLVAAV